MTSGKREGENRQTKDREKEKKQNAEIDCVGRIMRAKVMEKISFESHLHELKFLTFLHRKNLFLTSCRNHPF
jgi:hypothetical protein